MTIWGPNGPCEDQPHMENHYEDHGDGWGHGSSFITAGPPFLASASYKKRIVAQGKLALQFECNHETAFTAKFYLHDTDFITATCPVCGQEHTFMQDFGGWKQSK